MSSLSSLKKFTTVVADTGDFDSIAKFKPQDATTNPSLILQASGKPQYSHLLNDAIKFAKGKSSDPKEQVSWAVDKLLVNVRQPTACPVEQQRFTPRERRCQQGRGAVLSYIPLLEKIATLCATADDHQLLIGWAIAQTDDGGCRLHFPLQ